MKELIKEDLLKAGVQFGRERALWNPKMRNYIYALRVDDRNNESHIINTDLIFKALKDLEGELRQLIRDQKRILFVGTKKSVVNEKYKTVIVEREVRDENGGTKTVERRVRGPLESKRNLFLEFCQSLNSLGGEDGVKPNINYVDRRWIGGTLTNHRVISRQSNKLKDLMKEMQDPDFRKNNSYIEGLQKTKLADKMRKLYSGVVNMKKIPDALFVIDADHEKAAIREAKQLGVKVYATVNSHADPTLVDFVIPMNDESPKALNFLFNYMKNVITDELIHIQAENMNLSVEEYLENQKEAAGVTSTEVSDQPDEAASSSDVKNYLGDK